MAEQPTAPESPAREQLDYLEGRVHRLETELAFARDEQQAERRRRSNETWMYIGLLVGIGVGYYCYRARL